VFGEGKFVAENLPANVADRGGVTLLMFPEQIGPHELLVAHRTKVLLLLLLMLLLLLLLLLMLLWFINHLFVFIIVNSCKDN
jgi:hypothetical protein